MATSKVDGYFLSEQSKDDFSKMRRRVLQGPYQDGNEGDGPGQYNSNDTYIVQSPVAGIPGLTGVTPGTADCQCYQLNDDGTLEVVGEDALTVYNLSSTAVGSSKWLVVQQDNYGKFIVIFEGC